jgi:hypothetical protein
MKIELDLEKLPQNSLDSLTINRNNSTFNIFTIPTQHFTINSLDELTTERILLEIKKHEDNEKAIDELWKAYPNTSIDDSGYLREVLKSYGCDI